VVRSVLALSVLAVSAVVAGCGLFRTDLGVEGIDVEWIDVDGQDGRTALVVAPAARGEDPSPAGPLPVVVVLHGLGGTAEEMATMAGWPVAARDLGFLAVFPEGVSESWNAGGCCGRAMEWGVDDVGMLDALLTQLVQEHGADPERVYLTGYSNGAMMSHLYACRRPERVLGMASVAGTNFSDCRPGETVDVMQVSGSEDPVIPVLGGESSLENVGRVPSVEQTMLDWATAAGCAEPQGFRLDGILSFQGKDCSTGTRVRYDVIEGLGHEYPTAQASPGYVAVDKIVEFWGLSAPG
jgi:polyhydroxybutyrate depolymerase